MATPVLPPDEWNGKNSRNAQAESNNSDSPGCVFLAVFFIGLTAVLTMVFVYFILRWTP